MPDAETLDPRTSLASLATTRASASRVFHAHGLDYCCHGQESLAAACARRGLDPLALLAEIEAGRQLPAERWDERPLEQLIEHLLSRFHEPHRVELPRLIEMAAKVERVHAGKPGCPHGLAQTLERMRVELEEHMAKEEQVLFPLIRAGRGRMAAMPVQVLETEHRDHAANLARLRELTDDHTVPAGGCNTWHALVLGLSELEHDLMQHIHLENNVLFPRTLHG